MITISLDNLEMQEEEKETTIALIKGVLAGFVNHGYKIGGFKAYITSDVLIGAGLIIMKSVGIIFIPFYRMKSVRYL